MVPNRLLAQHVSNVLQLLRVRGFSIVRRQPWPEIPLMTAEIGNISAFRDSKSAALRSGCLSKWLFYKKSPV